VAGNRALYKDGWLARVIHKMPWAREPSVTLQEDVWELYNTADDFSLANDVSKQYPDKLKELQDEFMKVASENHVLPLDDRSFERLNAAIAGRPDLMGGRTTLTLRSGMKDLGENAFINGVILAQGGRFGGWSLYVKDGRPSYTYNYLGLQRTTIAATDPLPAGKSTIRSEFAYDGEGLGKGGTGSLLVDGRQVATGQIERTQAFLFSIDETADVAWTAPPL
jgi:hypothetical protein